MENAFRNILAKCTGVIYRFSAYFYKFELIKAVRIQQMQN